MNWFDFALGALAGTVSLTIILVTFAIHDDRKIMKEREEFHPQEVDA